MANKKTVTVILFLLLGSLLAPAVASFIPESSNCVNVRIDYGSLKGGIIEKCVEVNGTDTALNILKSADIELAGTNKYGLAVVCRVNGLPDASRESCAEMPPENAFWAFIYKNRVSATNLFPKWGWAQKGVSEVYFNPGDSLGLVFSENGNLKWPD